MARLRSPCQQRARAGSNPQSFRERDGEQKLLVGVADLDLRAGEAQLGTGSRHDQLANFREREFKGFLPTGEFRAFGIAYQGLVKANVEIITRQSRSPYAGQSNKGERQAWLFVPLPAAAILPKDALSHGGYATRGPSARPAYDPVR
jgi:hypothetical protein